ncbi:glycosyltransferase family 4 protein [Aquirufa sp. ROCK2-A2]
MSTPKVLFVSHDANIAGAQRILLHILQYRAKQGCESLLLLGEGGELRSEFEKVVKVIDWPKEVNRESILKKIAKKTPLKKVLAPNQKDFRKGLNDVKSALELFKPDVVFSNTIANGKLLEFVQFLKKPFLVYIHEMQNSILKYSNQNETSFQLTNSVHLLAGSESVKQNLVEAHQVDANKISVIPSLIDCEKLNLMFESIDRKAVREELNIPQEAVIVGGCGLAEWRKGVDLFIQVASMVLKVNPSVYFVWVGHERNDAFYQFQHDLEKMGIEQQVKILDTLVHPQQITACFDIFFLSSREDPYPLVMLEAGMNKNPIVCFDKTGGVVHFMEQYKELIVPYLDLEKAKEVILDLVGNKEKRIELGGKIKNESLKHDLTILGPVINKKIEEFLNNNFDL